MHDHTFSDALKQNSATRAKSRILTVSGQDYRSGIPQFPPA